MNINELARDIFEQNKAVGWWDNMDRCIVTTIQLISTEIAEATEGERKNLMDDHLPTRRMGEVELADALIRTLDIGGRFNVEVDSHTLEQRIAQVFDVNKEHAATPAVCHFWINSRIVDLGRTYSRQKSRDGTILIDAEYSMLLAEIIGVALYLGYDLQGATMDKLAYNKRRPDHKREARAQDGGKKF